MNNRKTNSENTFVSQETITRLFNWQQETDDKGYSEERVVDFIKILNLCNCIPIRLLLKLKVSQINGNIIKFYQTKKGGKNSVITLDLTAELEPLINKWLQNRNSAYVFPYLELTEKDNKRLEDAKSLGEINYNAEIQKIEAQKVRDFYRQMDKYLVRLGERLNLNEAIRLRQLRKALFTYFELDPKVNPLDFIKTSGRTGGSKKYFDYLMQKKLTSSFRDDLSA